MSNHSQNQFVGTVFRAAQWLESETQKDIIHRTELLRQIDDLWTQKCDTLEIAHTLTARGWSRTNEALVYNLLSMARRNRPPVDKAPEP